MVIYTFLDDKIKTKDALLYMGCFALVLVSFFYIQLESKNNYIIGKAEAIRLFDERSMGYYNAGCMLLGEGIFEDVSDHLNRYAGEMSIYDYGMRLLKNIIYISPLLYLYFRQFILSAKCRKKGIKKVIAYILPFCVFAIAPCVILETDYERWMSSMLQVLIIGLIIFYKKDNYIKRFDSKKVENILLVIFVMLASMADVSWSLT